MKTYIPYFGVPLGAAVVTLTEVFIDRETATVLTELAMITFRTL
jgi:hypothetical protein